MAERHGAGRVREAFDDLLDYAERRTRAAIAEMPDGRYEAAEALEGDGVAEGDLWIRVAVTIAGDAHDGRLHRHRSDRPGQLQLPARP